MKGSIFSNSVMVLRDAALEGVGITMVPLYCIQSDLAAGKLVPVFDQYTGPMRAVYAIYPHAMVSKKVRLFIEFTRKQLKANAIARRLESGPHRTSEEQLVD